MKLLLTIIQQRDMKRLLEAWAEEELHAVTFASSGGLLKEGNVTLLLWLEQKMVDRALDILRKNCEKQERVFPSLPSFAPYLDQMSSLPFTIIVGGATVFVLNLEQIVYSLDSASSV
ncbi:MAG: cyclic-di-AMP receptor [Candidatus Omnitrophica bacterium]|nr:cyclic-di-AMP receptor [Candidatus Omnitrophota bacterium]